MAQFKGIDVSKWQGDIDFNKVKADGIEFVIIKAGEKNFADGKFEQNYKRATAAGLSVGAYWYTHALTVEDMKAEANACMKLLAGKKFDYPIYCDFEESKQLALPKATQEKLICTWCDTLAANKWFPGFYMSKGPLSKLDNNVIGKYAVWVAQYYNRCTYKGSYGAWQYSSTGKVNGISGNVDMDISYVYYPEYIKKGGYNGYTSQSNVNNGANNSAGSNGTNSASTDAQKVSDTKMPTIRSGSKGKAVQVWQIIVGVNPDGKFGPQTLAATRMFQIRNELSVDGVVGPKTWKKGLESIN